MAEDLYWTEEWIEADLETATKANQDGGYISKNYAVSYSILATIGQNKANKLHTNIKNIENKIDSLNKVNVSLFNLIKTDINMEKNNK